MYNSTAGFSASLIFIMMPGWAGKASAATTTSSIAVSANVEAVCLVTGDPGADARFRVRCPGDVAYAISRSHAAMADAKPPVMDGAGPGDILISRDLGGAPEGGAGFVITTVTY